MQSRDPTTPLEDRDEDEIPPVSRDGSEAAGSSHTVDKQDVREQNADTPMKQLPAQEAELDAPSSTKPSALDEEDFKPELDPEVVPEEVESRNWMDLSMLEKLDTLHIVTEWQFQNPHRFRSLMKDDGDHGLWVSQVLSFFYVVVL